MPEHVRITDVSPRDGLQNEPGVIPTADKLRLIELLCATGVGEIEATSFVSPKWVPQLADAATLVKSLAHRTPPPPTRKGSSPIFSALIPNDRGLQSLLDADPDQNAVSKIALFTAASETFSKKNTNASIAETIERFRPVVALAQNHGLEIRGYVSCVIACPFEGPIAPEKVVEVARLLLDLGVDEIDLGDTIGAGDRASTESLLRAYDDAFPIASSAVPVTMHFHDTFGRAAECVMASLEHGVRSFDGAVAGLGGCPYAGTPGNRAPGNISTELLVRTVEDAGFLTGVNHAALAAAADFARRITAARPENPPA